MVFVKLKHFHLKTFTAKQIGNSLLGFVEKHLKQFFIICHLLVEIFEYRISINTVCLGSSFNVNKEYNYLFYLRKFHIVPSLVFFQKVVKMGLQFMLHIDKSPFNLAQKTADEVQLVPLFYFLDAIDSRNHQFFIVLISFIHCKLYPKLCYYLPKF